MKILCPHCERLLPVSQFRVEGAVLVVTCAACGAESRSEEPRALAAPGAVAFSAPPRVSLASVEGASNVVVLRTAGHEAVNKAALAAEQPEPFLAPDTVCPRCISPRTGSPECPHCGVRFEGYDETLAHPPRWLREEWLGLLRDWGNEAKHAQVRRKAQQLDALAAVGRLYRLRLVAVPEDPIAAQGREDVLRLASVPMSYGAPDDTLERRRRIVTLVGAGVVLVLAVLALWVMARR